MPGFAQRRYITNVSTNIAYAIVVRGTVNFNKLIKIIIMLQANDLKVGNFIKFNNNLQTEKIVQVDLRFFASLAGGRSSNEMKNDVQISDYYSGIKLTDEILDKINWGGYIKFNIGSYFKIDNVGHLYYRSDYSGVNINHLHQLQNIYYLLIGSELEIVW
jgi:hypothetical protein